jgi:hypothetical protein
MLWDKTFPVHLSAGGLSCMAYYKVATYKGKYILPQLKTRSTNNILARVWWCIAKPDPNQRIVIAWVSL